MSWSGLRLYRGVLVNSAIRSRSLSDRRSAIPASKADCRIVMFWVPLAARSGRTAALGRHPPEDGFSPLRPSRGRFRAWTAARSTTLPRHRTRKRPITTRSLGSPRHPPATGATTLNYRR
jgi:hypothetical protein